MKNDAECLKMAEGISGRPSTPPPSKVDHLLIDGKNCLYRAIYAGAGDQTFVKKNHDSIVIFFRFLNSYLYKFKPNSLHICWDAPKDTLWRKKIYTQYKDGRKHKLENAEELLNRNESIAREILPYFNCRNYAIDCQEADDLIYAFCRLKCHNKIMIISNDNDFKQIAYMFRNVRIYNPMSGVIYDGCNDIIDPVDMRCLMGEKSDNIDGYDGIGEKRAEKIITDQVKYKELFESRGVDTYMTNRRLIDLSICPYVDSNMTYVLRTLGNKPSFDIKGIINIIQKYKVRGLIGELSRVTMPFRALERT